MSGPPEVTISGGNPTPEEERAVREAILALWRADQADAARRAGGATGWTAAARAEATGAALLAARSWRDGLGLMQGGVLPARRVGRGDQR